MHPPARIVLSIACLLIGVAGRPHAPPDPPAKIALRAWNATASVNATADVIITAPGFPDLSPAQMLTTKQAKTRFVVEALLAHAHRAQSQLRSELTARGLRHVSLWITNQILVKDADRATLRWLATRSDVMRVDLDEKSKGIEWVDAKQDAGRQMLASAASARSSQASIEWNVIRVNAPQVWALGYTGQGIVIANLDTGVRWDHAALKARYRGWDGTVASHDYNWFDAAPDDNTPPSPVPVDLTGHGTHTTGTAVGDDGAGNQIGVAPGAQWIACRNMAGSFGIGSVSRYVACFQFALAPTDVNGNAPDPSKSADITSNSWACDPNYGEIGCDIPTALITATQVLRDAGVMVIASAGNAGSACQSVIHAPATLDQALTVGATTISNAIADFSSRGPSALTGGIKPDVVAPGVAVRSARAESTTAYGTSSGTSMAAPHVAGVVALLWSAVPDLRGNVEATEMILRQAASPLSSVEDCGGVSGASRPNNTYGYGLVDALAAVNLARSAPISAVSTDARIYAPITFTVTITNFTSLPRSNLVLTSSIPAATTLIASSPPGTVQGETLTWSFAELPPSSTLTASFVISTALTGSITSTAQLTYNGQATPLVGNTATTMVYGHRLFCPSIVHAP